MTVLGGTVLLGNGIWLGQRYPLVGWVLLTLTALGVIVCMPVLSVLVRILGPKVSPLLAGRPLRSVVVTLAVTAVLGSLLGLMLSADLADNQALAAGPDNAGVVVGFGEHTAVEAALSRTAGVATADSHLTTGVKPLAVNEVPLSQLVGQDATPDRLTELVDQFTEIQGYDLLHGQRVPSIGFASDFGSTGPGPNEIDARTCSATHRW
jgi:hypothetical protein